MEIVRQGGNENGMSGAVGVRRDAKAHVYTIKHVEVLRVRE